MPPQQTRERLLTAWCVAVCALAAGLAGALAVWGPLPALVPVLLFGALLALSEHFVVVLPNSSGLSASFMLGMAAVVVFRGDAPLLGPLLVGMCGGIYVPHLRGREWRKVAFNIGNLGCATLAAAAVFALFDLGADVGLLRLLLAAIPACIAFSLVNYLMLVVVLMLRDGSPAREAASELWLGDLEIFPFAVLGVFLGEIYLSFGAVVVPLLVAPILVARQTFASALELEASHNAVMATLTTALEAKDRYTAGHVERVARFSHYIGLELRFRPRRLQRLRFAALMHDVGKLVVPNELLNKPGRLTAAEFATVRRHEEVSRDILASIEFLAPMAPYAITESHLAPGVAARTPLEPHIVAVADAFDAMTSTRSYRQALSQEVAFAELQRQAGTQFHPRCVQALVSAIQRRGERYGAGHETDVAEWRVPPPVVGTGSAGIGDLAPEREQA
jgi:HD-GYP domain-containing protein (c-di-GMP phosphodiesterase class II)